MTLSREARITPTYLGRWREGHILCFSILILFAAPLGLGIANQDTGDWEELKVALEDAFMERTPDLKKRMEVAKAIEAKLSASTNLEKGDDAKHKTDELRFKSKFVLAVSNLRLNEMETSWLQVEQLRPMIDPKEFPELHFRCRSLRAALMLLRGDKEESANAYKELLSSDLAGIPEFLIDRARINLAAALSEMGQEKAAATIYESMMFSALEKQNDSSALHAGNNLLSILFEHGDTEAARRTLTELRPLLARNTGTTVFESIRLRELELLLQDGSVEESQSGLQEIIERSESSSPLIRGAAHRLLAYVLNRQNRVDEALGHAQQSVLLLRNNANEVVESHLIVAAILMKKQDYFGALETLKEIDIDRVRVAAHRKLFYQIRLEAELRQQSRDGEADTLKLLLNASEEFKEQNSQWVSSYFKERLEEVHRHLAEKEKEARSLIETQNDRESQRNRSFLLTVLGMAGLGFGLVFLIDYRRRAIRSRLEKQRMLNEKLEMLVAEKSRELSVNMNAQAEMAQALERKKRVETVGLLAGNVAHDINNLLQVIANSNQALESSASDDQQRSEALSVSNESLRHGSGIIRQLLAYSRQQELSARTLCMRDYLNESRPLFFSAVGDRIELAINDVRDDLYVYVDPSQLTTSILNILSNSSDAMPDGGKVEITAGLDQLTSDRKDSTWKSLPDGSYLRLSIKDNGFGMDAEHVARAFEPFFSSKSLKEGTGLGLSSVYGFVQQSGGEISIESIVGTGTRVDILLPICAPTAKKPQAPIQATKVSIAGKRILMVEDHEAVAHSFMLLLKHLELDATWAASGDDAILLLRKDPSFDFVLSDVHMPGVTDGPALARWIRSELPNLRVLLMSGYHEIPPDRIEVPLLQKPFTINQLSSFLVENLV